MRTIFMNVPVALSYKQLLHEAPNAITKAKYYITIKCQSQFTQRSTNLGKAGSLCYKPDHVLITGI